MIPRELPAVCLSCGHTRPWHSTGNGCTHEIVETKTTAPARTPDMKDVTWIRCTCEGWKI